MTFQEAVQGTLALQAAYRKGLSALRRTHKQHVRAEDTRRLTGSVDVDSTLKSDLPDEPRWDYAIGHQPTNLKHQIVYWVEVHPANDRGITEVLKKLDWLRQWLCEAAPLLKAMRREFVWVSSGKTSFTLLSPQQKQLAARGLQHKGHVFRITDEAAV